MTNENPPPNMDDEPEEKKSVLETPTSFPTAGDAPTLIQSSSRNMEDASVPESGNRIEMKSSFPDEGLAEVPENKKIVVSGHQSVDEQSSPEQDSLPEFDNLEEPSSPGADKAQNTEQQPLADEQKREIVQKLQKIKETIAKRQKKYQQIEDASKQDNLEGASQAAREAQINPYDPFAPFERMKRELTQAQEVAKELETIAQRASQRTGEIQRGAEKAQENLETLKELDEQARLKAKSVKEQLDNAQRQREELEKLVQPAEDDASQINNALQTAKTVSANLRKMAEVAKSHARSIANQHAAAQKDIEELQQWVEDAQSAKESSQSAHVDIENVIKREMAMQAVQQFAAQAQQSPIAWMNPSTLLVALRQLENLMSQIDESAKKRLQESLNSLQDMLSADLKNYGSLDEQAVEEWDTYFNNWLNFCKER